MDPAMSDPETPMSFADRYNQRSGTDEGELIFEQIQSGAPDLIDRMRNDFRVLDAVAFADMMVSLQQWFSDRAPIWVTDDQTSGPAGPGAAGAEWTYGGTHDRDGTFNGLPATGRDVEVHGYSVFTVGRAELDVRRYIDWAGLYAQLGLIVNWRVPILSGPDQLA
jgi:hypothetical protein